MVALFAKDLAIRPVSGGGVVVDVTSLTFVVVPGVGPVVVTVSLADMFLVSTAVSSAGYGVWAKSTNPNKRIAAATTHATLLAVVLLRSGFSSMMGSTMVPLHSLPPLSIERLLLACSPFQAHRKLGPFPLWDSRLHHP